jgi:hypothetical protein
MLKRIKNFDKIDARTFLYDDIMYTIRTRKPYEGFYENIYEMDILDEDLKTILIASIKIDFDEKTLEDKFRLDIKMPYTPIVMNISVFLESLSNFDLFCRDLETQLKVVLKNIKEHTTWKIASGFAI